MCASVFHTPITTKHSAVQLVHHPSTLHLVNHQQHTFLHATHTNPSRFFHNCPSFFSMSSSSSSFLRPLSVSCDGMHQLFAPIINTLCVPLWCHPVWPSLCFGALAVVPVVHHAIVIHSHHIWTVLLNGTHVASHSPHAIHFTSHSTLLLPSKCLPMMVSTSKSFGKSPLHTQVQSINHHHQSAFQHLTSHHMAQWVSNVDVTLATHHITITCTCFPPPTLHQWRWCVCAWT